MRFLKCSLIAALSLMNLVVFAQDYSKYLNSARLKFEQGKYENAQKLLNVYTRMTNDTNVELNTKISQCLKYQASAKEAEQSGDYASAKSYYESILKCNPKDPNASAIIARLNKLIAALRGKERVAAGESNQPPQEAAAPELEFTVNGVSFKMVYVQGGTFTMGATSEQGSDAYSDEKPAHRVTLSDYYIGKYEVTQGQWKAVMGSNPSGFKKEANYPVEKVSWNDIQEFIRKLNEKTGKRYMLPTEAQWEYAAHGGNRASGTRYSGSSNIDNVAWYSSNSGSATHPVGTKSPNELGIYDMSGNVWEWCADWYGDYSADSQTNPRGPSSGSFRVSRGGGWDGGAGGCRVSFRGINTPGDRSTYLGFRLVLLL